MAYRARFLGLLLLLFSASAMGAGVARLSSNVTGRWTVHLSTSGVRIFGTAELTQDGNQVSGWFMPNGGDRIALSGVLIFSRLIITTHPESRQRVAFDRCELDPDGYHMKGAFYPGKGKIEFIREREPRPSQTRNWH